MIEWREENKKHILYFGKTTVIFGWVELLNGKYSFHLSPSFHSLHYPSFSSITDAKEQGEYMYNEFIRSAGLSCAAKEGFVLVPKEPSEEMIRAGQDQLWQPLTSRESIKNIWDVMTGAANE